MSNELRLLGIARKAGRLEVGEEPVGAAARARKAKLILVAADAAENTCRRAAHFSQAGNVPWIKVPAGKSELGAAVGRNSCAMAALMDVGMASALVGQLAKEDPAAYGQVAQTIGEKAEKALRRQREKAAHEKNLRRGGKKSLKEGAGPKAPPRRKKQGQAPPAKPAPALKLGKGMRFSRKTGKKSREEV